MHGVDTEAERRGGDPSERGHELGESSRRDVALHARERDVRAEWLVVEGDLPVPQGLADALAEADEPVSALACAEPDDVRQPADGEAADAVEDDVERSGIARRRAHRFGRGGKAVRGDVTDEGERDVKERCGDVPERGKVSGEECRRALGYVSGELDRDEEADRRRLEPRGDPCRLDLIGDEEREEGDREDHGEHGQHGHPHRLVQLEVLPRRLDQLAHGLVLKQASCRMFDAQRSGNDACRGM